MTDRLTKHLYGTACVDTDHTISHLHGWYIGEPIDRLCAYEDSGLTPEEVQQLAKVKVDGRLVEIPCEVGDMIYVIETEFSRKGRKKVEIDHVTEYQVAHILLGNQVCLVYYNNAGLPQAVTPDEIGEAVFFTFEEAEKALKEADHGRSK